MSQWLRALAALLEDQSSDPGPIISPVTPVPEDVTQSVVCVCVHK